MYLAHRKHLKGRSIKHPFEKMGFPEQLEESRVMELTEKLRTIGLTKAEESELAIGHLRYIVSIAARYANAFPNQAHDMVSEGTRAIAWVLRHPEALYDNNITPFIVSKTHSFISEFLQADTLCGPRSTATPLKRKRRGLDSGAMTCHAFSLRTLNGHGAVKFSPQIETDELIAKIAITEEDQLILEMRLHLYNDREISERIGKSNSYVNNARKIMRERYERLVG
jgi:hypothetical protein